MPNPGYQLESSVIVMRQSSMLCPNRANLMRSGFVKRKGKLEDLNRSFNLAFWQSQSPQARFDAAWELVLHAWRVKGNDVRQPRLQRSVEAFQRIRS
jgi:hypothetical protein